MNRMRRSDSLRGGQMLIVVTRRLQREVLMGAEVGRHTVGTSSAPLTADPLSPSAGRGEETHRGDVLQPVLGLIR